jgi:hypothetical protein
MTRPKVLGLDLSLTAPGLACDGWAETLTVPHRVGPHRKRKDPREEAHARVEFVHYRIQWIRMSLADYLAGVSLVVMEGLAFDSHDTDRQNAGLSWQVRHDLWRRGIPYAVVPPTSLKQFVTGSGAADKALMVELVSDWFSWFDGDDNAADAVGLMAMGMAHLGCPLGVQQPHQDTAMSRVHWPEVVA